MRRTLLVCAVGTSLLVGAVGCASTEVDGQQEVLDGLEYVFPQDRVVTVEFDTPAGFEAMRTAYISTGKPDYVDAGFKFDATDTLDSVGLRLRAPATSGIGENETKFPLKVNFNYYGGERFHTLDKIYLSNNKSDPSLMRERLASEILTAMGVPASRTAYAWVKADGEDLGLFTMMEEVDKRFMRARFGADNHADDGNLYKCEVPGCDLTYQGDTKADYLDTTCLEEDGCGLVLKTNEDDISKNTYADLIAFLNVLNNEPDATFAEALDKVFEVDLFLRYMAVAVAMGDNDGYMGSIDNFYLYHRGDNDKWVFIPAEHRKAFGIKGCALAEDVSGIGPSSPECTTESRPLIERVMGVAAWKAQYLVYLRQVVEQYLDEAVVQAWVDEWEALAGPTIAEDPNSLVTESAHQTAIGATASEDNDLNLMEYVNKRRVYLTAELDTLGVSSTSTK